MTKLNKQEATAEWDVVKTRVMASIDSKNPAHKWALNKWLKLIEKNVHGAQGEPVHTCSTSEVIDALVEYFFAQIMNYIAIYQITLAEKKKEQASDALINAIGEFEGYFMDVEEGDGIVGKHLAIYRKTDEDRIRDKIEIVKESIIMAQSTGPVNVDSVSLPIGSIFEEYFKDLAKLINGHGNSARDIVMNICADKDCATEAYEDPESSDPSRFLAQAVLITFEHKNTSNSDNVIQLNKKREQWLQ